MTTLSYMPKNDDDRANLLEHVLATLPKYLTLLDISAQDFDELQADSISFRYALQNMGVMQAYSQSWTTTKNQLRDGGSGSESWPVVPALAQPVPAMVKPGVIPRLSALAARIKAHRNYTTAIGHDLWLIGGEQKIDPTTWKPALSIYLQAGHPVIGWAKGNAGTIEIWVDRSDGNNFVLLAIDTEPNTDDSNPLPTIGSGAIWKYKAIYRLHDLPVGNWSDVISVAVGI